MLGLIIGLKSADTSDGKILYISDQGFGAL
jgi:hypothetical protein